MRLSRSVASAPRLVRLVLGAGALVLLATQPWTGAQDADKTNAELAALDKKLNGVIATQQAILEKLDVVLEELRVIKVRVTVLR